MCARVKICAVKREREMRACGPVVAYAQFCAGLCERERGVLVCPALIEQGTG